MSKPTKWISPISILHLETKSKQDFSLSTFLSEVDHEETFHPWSPVSLAPLPLRKLSDYTSRGLRFTNYVNCMISHKIVNNTVILLSTDMKKIPKLSFKTPLF